MFHNSMNAAIKTIDAATTRMKEAIDTIDGAVITQGPAVVFKDSKITIQAGVDRNGTTVVAVESFTLDPDGDTAKTAVKVVYPDDNSVSHHETAPNGSREEMVELIKKHTMPPRIEWEMTPEQFVLFKDCLRRMDSDGRILGSVNIGLLRLNFQVEPRSDRESGGNSVHEQRLGTLLIADKDASPFIGVLPDGTRYTDICDLLHNEFESLMKGHFEVNPNDEYDYSLLTFPVFKERIERWIFDMVRASKQYENGAIDSSVFREPIPVWNQPEPDRFDEILAKFTDEAKKVTEKLITDYTAKMNDVFENYKKQLQ
jgi:hypothetical protein